MCGRHRNLRVIVVAVGLSLSTAAPARADSPEVASERVIEAIWRVQHLDFTYNSHRHQYTCDSLKNKVRAILRSMGAHETLTIDAGCSGNLIVQQMSARISIAAPVEATVENVRAATTFDARAQLVARLHDKRLPTATDLERFPASWRRVSLSRDNRLDLDAGDCELLDSIRRQLLPQLSVSVRAWGRLCSPGAASRVRRVYEIDALIPTKNSLVGQAGV
jgi:hypothetical protein